MAGNRARTQAARPSAVGLNPAAGQFGYAIISSSGPTTNRYDLSYS